MDDLNKPVRPIKAIESEKPKGQKIENFPYENEHFDTQQESLSKSTKKNFSLAMLDLVKKLFFLILPDKSKNLAPVLGSFSLKKDLKEVLLLLIAIRDENPSSDISFAEKFSFTWKKILSDYFFEKTKDQSNPLYLQKISELISSFDHYPDPEDELHSLGFYLKKFGESEWYPIPFFSILQKLHEEYFKEGTRSFLHGWIFLVEEILKTNPRS